MIQNLLHQRTHPRCNLIALFGQCTVHAHLANHFTHRGFGCLHHRFSRVLALEQESSRIAEPVLNGKFDFDNVFVFRQHGGLTQAGGLHDGVATDIDRANLGYKNQFVTLNWIRQTPVEAGADRGAVFSELGNDGLLPFLDNEEAGAQPDQQHDTGNQADADAGTFHVRLKTTTGAAASATRATAAGILQSAKQTAEFAVEITPQFVQIGRPLIGAAPRPALTAVLHGRSRFIRLRRFCIRFVTVRRFVLTATPA